jgi:2-keto-4-pentenoate hydratase/2-oxohepta-3-ene-1,7-dioic acid hydratase in catechol pathway
MKPLTSLADPYPAPTIIPKWTLKDDSCEYESEPAIIIGKKCKDISGAQGLGYVLGYTASNPRETQLTQCRCSYINGFDGACPIGPAFVIPDAAKLHMRVLKNGKVMQNSGIE